MASGHIYIDGLDDVINDFDRVVGDIDAESKIALTEGLKPIADKMKANANSMLDKTPSTQTLINSIGFHVGKVDKDGVRTASVGVYDTRGVVYPKTAGQNRTYTAAMVAHFHESGVRPHSTVASHRLEHSSGRKRKGNDSSRGIHGGLGVNPFLSNAFDSGAENIILAINKRLNNSIKG